MTLFRSSILSTTKYFIGLVTGTVKTHRLVYVCMTTSKTEHMIAVYSAETRRNESNITVELLGGNMEFWTGTYESEVTGEGIIVVIIIMIILLILSFKK